MEQLFMIEVFVQKIILKVEPPVKDAYELAEEAAEKKREAEAAAALLAAQKPKKGAKPPKPKKGKKGKEPPPPSEEEMKYAQTCTVQMHCPPLFEFYVAHDNFVAPPPPPPPPKKGKAAKPKKGKAVPFKLALPSEPLPQPPFFGVGSSVLFLSRSSKLEEMLHQTPIYVTAWNRNQDMNCTGFCVVEWHDAFFECLQRSAELNPQIMDRGEYRDTSKPQMVTTTVEVTRPLHCEESLSPSGEVVFYIRLTCFGSSLVSYFISLPEMERIPGRKYLCDDLNLKDIEVVRHWEGSFADDIPPIAYFFGAPDITREPIREEPPPVVFKEFVAPYTKSELAILAMGFPKGPCGGINCPKRMDFRGSQHLFIPGEMVKGRYHQGQFINKRDVHGPCGRLDCPLAKKVRQFICNEGTYKSCKKPCPTGYY